MATRGRYLTPAEFGRLLAELRITSTMFQTPLLEWLERERIVVPIARIRWPDSMVLENRGVATAPPPTDAERSASEALNRALALWKRPDADPELCHPLDHPEPPGARLVEKRVGERPFETWDSMRTNIAPQGAPPLYVTDGVDTYYHGWQALLVADALEMGVRVIFDTREPDRLALAHERDLTRLPEDPHRCHLVSYHAPRGLKAGLKWAPFLDAAARLEIVRHRKTAAIWRAHGNEPFTLEGAERDEFNASSVREAVARVTELGASLADVVEFIVYLCDRWDEWTRHGRAEVAADYARQLRRALRLTKDAFGLTEAQVETEVGNAFGDGHARLSVILPDWTREARVQLERSLRHAVLPGAPPAGPQLTLDESDLTDLLDWLSAHSWKVHFAVEEIIEHQFGGTPQSHDAHARAVESLTSTFEHLVGDLLAEAGIAPTGTLKPKLTKLWSSDADVTPALAAHYNLTRTGPASRADQLAAIAALPAGNKTGVVQALLRTVLYRNDGQHNSMSRWLDPELHDAAIAILTALLFSRKHALVNPPPP